MNYTIGIDIGTNKISGVLTNTSDFSVADKIVRENNSFLPSESFETLQSPEQIYEIAKDIIDDLINDLEDEDKVTYIGFTGQMHSMLYIDENGQAVSPLFNWQDQRGNKIYRNDITYCNHIKAVALRRATTGSGLVTHFFNYKNSFIPGNAKKIVTISCYVAMQLTNTKKAILHTSEADSFDLYNLESNCFDLSAMEKLGLDTDILPEVSKNIIVLGKYEDTQVLLPIGDNQASFYGSCKEDNSVLVNIGTSGQVVIQTEYYRYCDGLEPRPYFGDEYLLIGSSICGGHSYKLLKDFFEMTFNMFNVEVPEAMYSKMTLSAFEGYRIGNPLTVATQFKGTKRDSSLKGSISDITPENFTPMHLSLGILQGVCDELYHIVQNELPENFALVGSNKGIRENTLLQKLISERFQHPITIPSCDEEAAFGVSKLYLMEENKNEI